MYLEGKQIGFQCFAAYVPGNQKMYFSNRTVIHPDYQGFGLGMKVINLTSQDMFDKGFDIRATYSSTPVYKSMSKNPSWQLMKIKRDIIQKKFGKNIGRGKLKKNTARHKTTVYSFKYVGNS